MGAGIWGKIKKGFGKFKDGLGKVIHKVVPIASDIINKAKPIVGALKPFIPGHIGNAIDKGIDYADKGLKFGESLIDNKTFHTKFI